MQINRNMKNYKLLESADQSIITEKLYEFVVNNTNILNQGFFWNDVDIDKILTNIPELDTFFKKYKLVSPTRMAILCVLPTSTISENTHIDTPGENIRLLWPVKNCQGSFTRFFNVDPKFIELQHLDNGVPFYKITHNGPHEMIDELELLMPVIINASVPHGVCPNPELSEPRLTFTVHFSNSIARYLI